MIEEIIKMKKDSDKGLKPQKSSWTGDAHGHEFLFNNPKFNEFHKEVEKHIFKYMDHFKLNHENLLFYFQRSWATLSNSMENISPHKHAQSHLSFAYYLKKEPEEAKLVLMDIHKHSEFIPELFTSTSVDRNKIFRERSLENTAKIDLEIKEGDIIIFPSKTIHGTEKGMLNNQRISISADILITAKETTNLEHLTPQFSKWKEFSSN